MEKLTSEADLYLQAQKDAAEFSMLIDKLERASEDGIHITIDEAKILLYQILES